MDLRKSLAVAVLAGAALHTAPALAAAPPNDNFANAQVLSGTATSVPGTTVGATAEPGEPGHPSSQDHTVWYSWTPPQDMVVQLDTCNSSNSFITRIWSGATLTSLVELDPRNDEPFPGGCPSGGSYDFHWYDVTGGTTYSISVMQLFSGGDGPFTLSLNAMPRPANDDFAGAQDLGQALEVGVDGTTFGAGTEPGEPGFSDGGNSVWYRWTAPKRTRVRIDNCNAETRSAVTVYKGASLEALTEVQPDNSTTPEPPGCEGDDQNGRGGGFLATADTTYMFQVATRLRDQGAFHLRLQAFRYDATLHQEVSAKKIKQGKTVTYAIEIGRRWCRPRASPRTLGGRHERHHLQAGDDARQPPRGGALQDRPEAGREHADHRQGEALGVAEPLGRARDRRRGPGQRGRRCGQRRRQAEAAPTPLGAPVSSGPAARSGSGWRPRSRSPGSSRKR